MHPHYSYMYGSDVAKVASEGRHCVGMGNVDHTIITHVHWNHVVFIPFTLCVQVWRWNPPHQPRVVYPRLLPSFSALCRAAGTAPAAPLATTTSAATAVTAAPATVAAAATPSLPRAGGRELSHSISPDGPRPWLSRKPSW